MTATKYYKNPFAVAGDVAAIPNNLGIVIKADQLNAFEGMLN